MGNMTMDVIGAAAFAMDVNAQRDPNNQFIKHARTLGTLTFKDWRVKAIRKFKVYFAFFVSYCCFILLMLVFYF